MPTQQEVNIDATRYRIHNSTAATLTVQAYLK